MCVFMDQEQDTANFIWTAKGIGRQLKVKGCPSVVVGVFCHLMLFDVSASDTTVPTPCEILFCGLHKAFLKRFTCCLHSTQHTHLFYAHQQRKNPKSTSLNNGHK